MPNWKLTIKDGLGNPLWELTNFSAFIQPTGCDFSVMAKNVSGMSIPGPFLGLLVDPSLPSHWTPGLMALTGVDPARLKAPGETTAAMYFLSLDPRWDPKPENFGFFSISIDRMGGPGSWYSPQELAALKKSREDTDAGERRLRADCAVVYRKTIDKPQGDLTTRETQAIAGCSLLGLYHQ
jgi:hypothetical protein